MSLGPNPITSLPLSHNAFAIVIPANAGIHCFRRHVAQKLVPSVRWDDDVGTKGTEATKSGPEHNYLRPLKVLLKVLKV